MMARLPVVVFIALLALAPLALPEFFVTLINYVGLYALVALGLVLLTGVGGLTSFGQAAFVGVGAYATGWLTTAHGVSPWLGLLAGLLITGVIALALGAVTLRLSGHFLPLGTIAWGISLYFLFGTIEGLGGYTGLSGIPALSFFGLELRSGPQYYFLIWGIVLLALLACRNLLDSRDGRAMRALKGGGVMAAAMGVPVARMKIILFVLAAELACISGWLYAHLQRFLNPTPFSLTQGIEYLFMAVVGGIAHVWGAILGAAVVAILKQWLQDALPQLLGQSGNFEIIVFGLIMVLVLQRARDGLWPFLARASARFVRETPAAVIPDADALPRRPMPQRGQTILDVRDLSKHFGGLVANNRINLQVKAGEVLALIGPNGAGKSTLFNLISGELDPTSGEIEFLGHRIECLDAPQIARLGMSRTFQHVRLLPQMSGLDNVALGAHLRGVKNFLHAALRLDRGEEARLRAEAARQIERVGLAAHLHTAAGSLALGKQRVLEIARALAADPSLLLLDEPAAGLRYQEKQALAELIRKLREEGMAVLLVEHDMEFVMGLADRVVVVEFGQKIAEGLPSEVQNDPAVREAYLGGGE